VRNVALIVLLMTACGRAASPSHTGSPSSTPDASQEAEPQPSADSSDHAKDSGTSDAGRVDSGSAEQAAVASSAGLGPWTMTADYPLAANRCSGTAGNRVCAQQTCLASAGYAYCLGAASTSTYYSPLSSTEVGPWTRGADYPVPIEGPSCVISANYIYCVGGSSDKANVYYAQLLSPGIGPWTASTPFPQLHFA
jgi:hypothetical protein